MPPPPVQKLSLPDDPPDPLFLCQGGVLPQLVPTSHHPQYQRPLWRSCRCGNQEQQTHKANAINTSDSEAASFLLPALRPGFSPRQRARGAQRGVSVARSPLRKLPADLRFLRVLENKESPPGNKPGQRAGTESRALRDKPSV